MVSTEGFFAWEAYWGKVLILDQLQRKGWFLVNQYFLCMKEEELVDIFFYIVPELEAYGILFSPCLEFLG